MLGKGRPLSQQGQVYYQQRVLDYLDLLPEPLHSIWGEQQVQEAFMDLTPGCGVYSFFKK
eukprot:gene1877-2213_t